MGCKIRFDDQTGRDTRIKFMTDGILLAEIQSDPLLRAYGTLILDEAHERSLNIDFLLGYLKELLRRRPPGDLRLVITSATIDTAAFSAAFGGAPVVEVSGRLYPVEIRYQPVGGVGRARTGRRNPRRGRRPRDGGRAPRIRQRATCSFSCPPNATSAKRATCSKPASDAARRSSASTAGCPPPSRRGCSPPARRGG